MQDDRKCREALIETVMKRHPTDQRVSTFCLEEERWRHPTPGGSCLTETPPDADPTLRDHLNPIRLERLDWPCGSG